MEVSISAGRACPTAVLVRSPAKLCTEGIDLPSNHCAALSDLADKLKCSTHSVTIRGPIVGCRAIQALADRWPALKNLSILGSARLGVESM